MNKKILSFFYTIFFICLFMGIDSSGQSIKFKGTDYSQPLTASQLVDGSAVPSTPNANSQEVISDLWYTLDPNQNNNSVGKLKVKDLRSYVKFSVDHSNPNVFPEYTYRARIQVLGYTDPGNDNAVSTIYDTLTISYRPDSILAYQDIHMKSYYGFYKVNVTVLDIFDYTCISSNPPCTNANFPQGFISSNSTAQMIKNFRFDVGIEYQKVDKQIKDASGWRETLDPSVQLYADKMPPLNNDNHLTIDWEISQTPLVNLPTTSLYELEWVYVDDYKVTFSQSSLYSGAVNFAQKPITDCYFDFNNNATRIITDQTQYKIPLIYKRGYIVYRVRILRPDYINFKNTVYGSWSINTTQGSVNNLGSNNYYQITSPHLDDKYNWNYEASFAEEGKSKQVVSYFDGLLKNRQTITKFNSQPDQQIVTEQFYDYEGRQALQLLPIPTQQTPLQFIPSFSYPNNSSTANTYVASDIDNITPSPLTGLNTQSLASKYYSSSNPFYNGGQSTAWNFLKSLPKDNGFPLIQTQYESEDGKVKAQGGAGNQLQIGTGHETKNFYLAPEQYELNKYLGANVGKASFYKKTITKDPNKQLSFSIIDNKGQLVLSGLMGDPNNSASAPLVTPDEAPTNANHTISTDLLAGITPIWDGNSMKINKSFFMETPGIIQIEQSLSLDAFSPCQFGNSPANPPYLSIPLQYQLNIIDESGNVQQVIQPSSIGSISSSQNPSTTTISNINPPLNVNITDGEKIVDYQISYNPSDINAAVEQFIHPAIPNPIPQGYTPPTTCLKSLSDFEKDQLDAVPENCDEVYQGSGLSTPCSELESLLKSELYPMAKYGKYIEDDNTGIVIGAFGSMYAIVNLNIPNNPLPSFDDYSYAQALSSGTPPLYRYQAYLNDLRTAAVISGNTILVSTIDIYLNMPVKDFIENFDDNVASFFLKMHPEYCAFEKHFCDNSNFINDLSNLDYASAKAKGLNTPHLIALQDPFFAVINSSSLSLSLEETRVMLNPPSSVTSSPIDVEAYTQTFCNDDPQCRNDIINNASNIQSYIDNLTDPDEQNRYFSKLVNLYIANRQDLTERYPLLNASNCSNIVNKLPLLIQPQIIKSPYTNAIDNLPSSDILDQNATSELNNLMSGTPTAGQTIISNNIATNNSSNYDAYADAIIFKLSNCLPNTSLSQVKTDIINFCTNHSGQNAPWMGGLTPNDLKNILIANGISLDDLCNPYLVDYLQELKPQLEPCKNPNFYSDINGLFVSGSSIYYSIEQAGANPNNYYSGSITINASNPSNEFQTALYQKFGTTNINYKVKYYTSANDIYIVVYFYSGTFSYDKVVSIYMKFTPGNNSLPINFATLLYGNSGNQYPITFNFNCNNNSSSAGIPITPTLQYHVSDATLDIPFTFSGYILGLKDVQPEQQSCLTCLEMKKAFDEFKAQVMDNTGYNIKGFGHPLFDDAVRSFFNFYFKKNHTAEEYINFMKSCNLSDYNEIPEYYAYFKASTGTNNISSSEAATDLIDNFFQTYQSGIYKNYTHFYYLVKDANNTTTETDFYVDFRYFPKNLLRQIETDLTNYILSNTQNQNLNPLNYTVPTPNLYFNTLENEIGSSANFADLFVRYTNGLPDYNPYLPANYNSQLSVTPSNYNWLPFLCSINSCGVNQINSNDNITLVTNPNEKITVKDNGLSTDFRRFHFDLTNSSATASDKAKFTYYFNTQVLPNSSWGFVSFNQYHSDLDAENLDNAKKNYLTYLYNKETITPYSSAIPSWTETDKSDLINSLQPDILKQNITSANYNTNYNSYPYISYYNPDKGLASGDLFIQKGGTTPGITDISNILNFVYNNTTFVYNNTTVNTSFPIITTSINNFSNSNTGGTETVTVKLLDGNVIWYHMKDVNTKKQRNIYLKFPEKVDPSSVNLYSISGVPSIVPNSEKARRFKVTLQRSAFPDITVYGKTDFDLTTPDITVFDNIMLCDDINASYDTISTCYEKQLAAVPYNSQEAYASYIDSMRTDITQRFTSHIKQNLTNSLKLNYDQTDYQVTVYRYDRACNLIATIPPAGVVALSDANQTPVNNYRDGVGSYSQSLLPAHQKVSSYAYSSNNNLYSSNTPDASATTFYYDVSGRLIFSQNAKQAAENKFSYNIYDEQSRIIETGQLIKTISFYNTYILDLWQMTYLHSQADIQAAISNLSRTDVIHTFYDEEILNLSTVPGMSRQEYLRGRVAASAHYNNLNYGQSASATNFDIALHYSYDLSGNVKTLTYDVPSLSNVRQRYKRIDYDYDLFSGKVNMLSYNRSFADQFYQRYTYDDDNRIKTVQTSKDGLLWDNDATYKYYPHGPLARIDLGDLKVQGVDYAYTLQGWLKSINGDTPDPNYDIGNDGSATSVTPNLTDLNRSTLYYFNNDYNPIDGTNYPSGQTNPNNLWQIPSVNTSQSLYNGNITAAVSIPGYFPSLYTNYTYDQLNRIKDAQYSMPIYSLNNAAPTAAILSNLSALSGTTIGSGATTNDAYRSQYTYDKDGNIKTLKRFGLLSSNLYNNASGHAYQGAQTYLMDNLTYFYQNSGTNAQNNKLINFTDAANNNSVSNFNNDIQPYNPNNPASTPRLGYDAIGNLNLDQSNNLNSINWNLYNKVTAINMGTGNNIKWLNFNYDPLNNRFSKSLKDNLQLEFQNEYYYRDVTGNILATYREHQKYHNAPLLPILVTMSPSGSFGPDVSASGVASGTFVSALLQGVQTNSGSYASTITDNKPLQFYLDKNPLLLSSLLQTNGNLIYDVYNYDSSIITQPLTQSVVHDFFAPLFIAKYAPDDPELATYDNVETIVNMLVADDDAETRNAIGTSAQLDGNMEDKTEFVQKFSEYISRHAQEEVYHVLNVTLNEQNLPYAISTMIRDSLYMRHNYEGYNYGNLMRYLQATIVTDATRVPLNNYLTQRDDANDLIKTVTTLQERLATVYEDNPGDFINSYKVQANALDNIASSLAAAQITPSYFVDALLKVNPNNTDYANIPLVSILDDDNFYLAEHEIYGSARLGLKTYWPTQYIYQWDASKTATENQALLDASAFSYNRPWYSAKYNTLISATSLEPYGNNSTMPIYSERVLGQKRYELTNHLGNVMAVVTDKITEVPQNGGTPTFSGLPALRRAALYAAYDYYPFGMLMPQRYVEDNTAQCTPLTTNYFTKVSNLQNGIRFNAPHQIDLFNFQNELLDGDPLEALGEGDQDGYVLLKLRPDLEVPDNGLQFASTQFSTISANQEFAISTQVTSEDRMPVVVQVVQDTGGDAPAVLASYDVPYDANAQLSGTAINGNPLQLLYKTLGTGGAIKIGATFYNTIDVVTGSYVSLICSNPFNFGNDYRFGFNGQEKVNEIAGIGNHLDFKFRGYDSRLGKFWSVDPLATKYPWNSTYAFAENRPIDGIDLEGREWDRSTDKNGNVNVTVNMEFNAPKGGMPEGASSVDEYKNAINNQLNTTLCESSGGTVSGSVTFNGGNSKEIGRVIPTLNMYTKKNQENAAVVISGNTSFNSSSVNLYHKDNTIKTTEEYAEDVVHELLHTLRISHPYEQTQGNDTRLINTGPNAYQSTPTTDKNIKFNIMNYPMISIDGQGLREAWKTQKPILMTHDQLQLMFNEIDLQKGGAGMPGPDYFNYWIDFPGTEVPKAK